MQAPGRVYSRAQLLDAVWGRDVYIDERTVDVHVGRLRKAITPANAKDPLRTVRGAGYAFDETFARGDTALARAAPAASPKKKPAARAGFPV